ncbi:MFS transporter [Microbacterium hatanonis]|uniref:MFS transporter n=1 Tax=Microbacterium hatanonis TaxID=404366 RepID=A0A5C8I262_9MICO|nr:MFS transporter [Microbacterium hatanonis]TXK13097.1 MFS transporter [Microbacterium hatanonis]
MTDPIVKQESEDERWTSAIAVHYDSKKRLSRYIRGYLFLAIAIAAIWTSSQGILMPNQVQILQFGQFFFGPDAGVDLQALTELGRAVAAGDIQPTAEQTRQLALLSDFEASRAAGLALVTTTSAIVVMILQPVIGVMSDRTRSKAGRRAPWILYAALVGAVLLVAVRFAPSVAVLVVLWTLTELAFNVASNPLQATVADRVPRDRRGRVTSWTSMGSIIGGLIGGIGAGALFGLIGLDFYLILALVVVIAAVLFVTRNRDESSVELERDKFAWKPFLRGYASALKAPNYRWLWISRALFFFGYSTTTVLSLYMLQSYISPALSATQASATVPLLGLCGIPTTLIAVAVSGRLSDRIGRRKPFVVVASILMAISLSIPLISPTLPALFIQVIITGAAFGIYIPVDNAMFIDFLPDPARAGRDLGLATVAMNLGQALAPALAAVVVAVTGGYQFVWVAALVLVALATLTIAPIKEKRHTLA